MRIATRRARTTPTIGAAERARRAWADMARETRTELRTMGVHGPLRRLDEATSGTRGRAVPQGMAALAQEMRAHGVPRAEAAERLRHFAEDLVALVYHDSNGAA